MIMFETVLQDLRYGARTLLRNAGFNAVSIIALALGIGVNTAVFTAYKAYRDRLHSFSGVIAFSIDQLKLTDAGGIASQRSTQGASLFGRLGLLRPGASNAEFASTFIVSENYFSVLGVAALRGRTFESIGLPELAASPAVLISENHWQRRFAGDPAVLGKSIRLNGVALTIVGITPHNFVGTSIATPNFWLPLSLSPLVHPERHGLRDRNDVCCRVFGRLAPRVSMTEAQAETTLLSIAGRPAGTFRHPQRIGGPAALARTEPHRPQPAPRYRRAIPQQG
jgi:hypothetical protein